MFIFDPVNDFRDISPIRVAMPSGIPGLDIDSEGVRRRLGIGTPVGQKGAGLGFDSLPGVVDALGQFEFPELRG